MKKEVTDEKFGDRTFYGVRLYLKSPEELHSDPVDDDRSAVTFWVPWTNAKGLDPEKLAWIFDKLCEATGEIPGGKRG